MCFRKLAFGSAFALPVWRSTLGASPRRGELSAHPILRAWRLWIECLSQISCEGRGVCARAVLRLGRVCRADGVPLADEYLSKSPAIRPLFCLDWLASEIRSTRGQSGVESQNSVVTSIIVDIFTFVNPPNLLKNKRFLAFFGRFGRIGESPHFSRNPYKSATSCIFRCVGNARKPGLFCDVAESLLRWRLAFRGIVPALARSPR
jgi:hypothetical protein